MELLKEVNDLLAQAEEPYEETEEQLAPYFDVISSFSFSSALLIRTLEFKEFKRISYDFTKIIQEQVKKDKVRISFFYLHPKSKRKIRKFIFSNILTIPISPTDYKKLFIHESKTVLPVSERLRLLTKGNDVSSYHFLSKKEEEQLLFPLRLLFYYYLCLILHLHDQENTLIKRMRCLFSLLEEDFFAFGRKEFFDLSTDSYIHSLTDNSHTQEALKKEINLFYTRNRNTWDPFINPPTPKIDKHNFRSFPSIEGFSGLDEGEPTFYFKRTCLPKQTEIDSYKEALLLKCQQRLNIIKNRSLEKKDQFHLKELKQRIENINNWKAIE